MKKFIKAIMYVYRDNNGKKEFFVLHRKRGDIVTLTGHVADKEEIKDESIEDAARRETIEELGVEPIKVIDLNMSVYVKIEKVNEEDQEGYEHAFLVQIPNKDVHFLEGDEEHKWYTIDELYNVLTYSNQKEPLDKIKDLL
jgi:8-oxo-dGTP pyrophosphatase MutT (NUDIX family)